MTVSRDRPWDFAEQAAALSNNALQKLYGAGQHTVTRWRAEIGAAVASTGATHPLPVPDDWHQLAPGKSKRELKRIYQRHTKTIDRWCKQAPVETNGKPNPNGERVRPNDFAERWQEMSQVELMAHYRCGKPAVYRWVSELGLKRPPRVAAVQTRAPTQLKAVFVPVDRLQRDMSRAGQAADYLRRFGPVARCDARGRYDENGTHWRRGSTVLTADEVVERAVRNGWQPDAWRMVA